jgi:hypothetical protein
MSQGGALNPWASIWIRPRATTRFLLDSDPQRAVVVLGALTGVYHALDRASGRDAGDKIPGFAIALAVLLVGPLAGVLKVYVSAALLRLAGRWLGGGASAEELRTAVAWGSVPLLVSLVLWVPLLLLFGREMFSRDAPRLAAGGPSTIVFFVIVAGQLVLGIWSLILSLKAVGEAQEFSAWRALANFILAGMIVLVPIVVVLGVLLLVR